MAKTKVLQTEEQDFSMNIHNELQKHRLVSLFSQFPDMQQIYNAFLHINNTN